jgi:hypothetical protein
MVHFRYEIHLLPYIMRFILRDAYNVPEGHEHEIKYDTNYDTSVREAIIAYGKLSRQ